MKSTKYNASNIKCQISFLPRPVTKLFLYIKDISESEGSHVGVYIRVTSGTVQNIHITNPHTKLETLRSVYENMYMLTTFSIDSYTHRSFLYPTTQLQF